MKLYWILIYSACFLGLHFALLPLIEIGLWKLYVVCITIIGILPIFFKWEVDINENN